MAIFKRNHLFQTIILGIHVSFRGCHSLKAFTSGKVPETSSIPGFPSKFCHICGVFCCSRIFIFLGPTNALITSFFIMRKSHKFDEKTSRSTYIGCLTNPFSSSTNRSDPIGFLDVFGVYPLVVSNRTYPGPGTTHPRCFPETTTVASTRRPTCGLQRSCCETQALKSRSTGWIYENHAKWIELLHVYIGGSGRYRLFPRLCSMILSQFWTSKNAGCMFFFQFVSIKQCSWHFLPTHVQQCT